MDSHKKCLNGFEWVKETSKFNEGFKEGNNEENDERYFLEADVQHPEKLHELHDDLPFYQKFYKIEKLVTNLQDKKESYSRNKFETIIKLCISFEKSSQIHFAQMKGLVKVIH